MTSEKIGGELLKGHLETLVLSVLAESPRPGYDIMKTISARSSGVFDLGQGTIYPLLYTLEDKNLIRSKEETVNGRRRRVYRLSASGGKRLKARVSLWKSFQKAVDGVLAPALREGITHA